MGGIVDEHVEWAVVNRLKAMLDEPPNTRFNVTLSFALFSAVLLWTKNRAWVGGDRKDRPPWFTEVDDAARGARKKLRDANILDAPWLLSRTPPQVVFSENDGELPFADPKINMDFAEMSAEAFFKWLRDALAHGDGRTIKPLHRPSKCSRKTLLTGFKIVFEKRKGSCQKLRLTLYHADMKRMGTILADQFCTALSRDDHYFEQEAGTASIEEATRVA